MFIDSDIKEYLFKLWDSKTSCMNNYYKMVLYVILYVYC